MEKIFNRRAELLFDNTKVSGDDLDIGFEVEFDFFPEPNMGKVWVYNVSKDTAAKIRQSKQVILNAGYGQDIGTVMVGGVYRVAEYVERTDTLIEVDIYDQPNMWGRRIKTTYRGRTTAMSIISDITATYGLKIGKYDLPRNVIYNRGKMIDATIEGLLRELAADCGARLYITDGSVYILPEGEPESRSVVTVLDSDTGLLGVSRIDLRGLKEDQNEITEGVKVQMLFNHRIRANSIIRVKGVLIAGLYQVISGKHISNSYSTEVDCVPVRG